MKKKAKPARGKPAASAKTVTKIEPVASFFNFFKPPQEPEDEDIDEDEIEELRSALEEDFEIGQGSLPSFGMLQGRFNLPCSCYMGSILEENQCSLIVWYRSFIW